MKPSPDKIFGPQLAAVFQKYCLVVLAECGATAMRVEAEFTFRSGAGTLKLKTFTTPDAVTERMLDPEVPMPRGSKLQHEVVMKLTSAWTNLNKKIGGK